MTNMASILLAVTMATPTCSWRESTCTTAKPWVGAALCAMGYIVS